MSTSSKHLLFIFLNSLDLVCRQTRLEFFAENLTLQSTAVKLNFWDEIFQISDKVRKSLITPIMERLQIRERKVVFQSSQFGSLPR